MSTKITAALLKQMQRAHERGSSHRQIALAHNLTKAQVGSALYRARKGEAVGEPRPGIPEPTAAILRRMVAEQTSMAAMAEATGISTSSIPGVLARLLGKPYVRDKALTYAERVARAKANGYQAPTPVRTDHLKHCLAVMNNEAHDKPKGCGFPVLASRAAYRVAA